MGTEYERCGALLSALHNEVCDAAQKAFEENEANVNTARRDLNGAHAELEEEKEKFDNAHRVLDGKRQDVRNAVEKLEAPKRAFDAANRALDRVQRDMDRAKEYLESKKEDCEFSSCSCK